MSGGGDTSTSTFSRFATLCIVAATLAAGMAGFLLSIATQRGAHIASRVQELAVKANAEVIEARRSALLDYEAFVHAEAERRRASQAIVENISSAGARYADLDQRRARWASIADQTEKSTTIRQGSAIGPNADPAFPWRFLASRAGRSWELSALQDAANEEGSGWAKQSSAYAAILAFLAVALYLFGSSETLAGNLRPVFIGVGLTLLTTGSLWMTINVLLMPDRPPVEAAEAFAKGRVALDGASNRAQYETAAKHLTRAIDLRPSFAEAYVVRAEAIFGAASPQRGSSFISITEPEALRRSTADYRRAVELGLQTPIAFNGLSNGLLHSGLTQKDDGLITESVGHAHRAIDLLPNEPLNHFNLGTALLALGDDGASLAYRNAIHLALYTTLAGRERRDDAALARDWVAGVLTDLDAVIRHRPERRAAARSAKHEIVDEVSRGVLGVHGKPVALQDVEASVFPAEVQVKFTPQRPLTDKDAVTIVWYADIAGLGASVLPAVTDFVPGDFLSVNDGDAFALWQYLPYTKACLSRGDYRVEVYVNGRLAGRASNTPEIQPFQTVVDPELNVAFCRPPRWKRSGLDLPGIVDGYRSADGSRGAFVFRFSGVFDDRSEDERATAALDGVMGTLAPGFGALPSAATAGEVVDEFFMDLENGITRYYELPGGQARAGAGLLPDGSVLIAYVYGGAGDFDEAGSELINIHDSFTLFQTE